MDPLSLVTKSVSGRPPSIKIKDGYEVPTAPGVWLDHWPSLEDWPDGIDVPLRYAYVEELPYPEEAPAEGFIWTRELTIEAYGWKQVEAPPAPNPEWYIQPAWRIRAIAKANPFGAGTLLDAATAAIDAIADPLEKIVAEEVFFGGNTLERDSALLAGMATGLGLTDAQLNDLFQQAAAIEV